MACQITHPKKWKTCPTCWTFLIKLWTSSFTLVKQLFKITHNAIQLVKQQNIVAPRSLKFL